MLHLRTDFQFALYDVRLVHPKIVGRWIHHRTFPSPVQLNSALYFFGRDDDPVGACRRFRVPEPELLEDALEVRALHGSEYTFPGLLENIMRAVPEVTGRGVYERQVLRFSVGDDVVYESGGGRNHEVEFREVPRLYRLGELGQVNVMIVFPWERVAGCRL